MESAAGAAEEVQLDFALQDAEVAAAAPGASPSNHLRNYRSAVVVLLAAQEQRQNQQVRPEARTGCRPQQAQGAAALAAYLF